MTHPIKVTRFTLIAGALVLAGLAAWWIIVALTDGKTAQIEATIAGNRADAASQSGSEAVQTVGDQATSETAIDDLTRSNSNEIRSADGADAPVSSDLRGAGMRSLCRRAAYRDSEKCLQQPAAD